MELRHLRYFVAVAEEKSFTRAAERLWIAQPGLSQQIRALERELGVCLFERHSRGAVLTEAGSRFLAQARATLSAADSAIATGRGAAAGLLGSLRIGLSTLARGDLGLLVLDAFRAERPQVDVTVIEAHSDTLVRDVRDERLDAAIVLAPVRFPGLETAHLRNERVVVAMSARHALAGRERVHARELESQIVLVSGDRDAAGYDSRVRELLGSRASTRCAGHAIVATLRHSLAVALVSASATDASVVTRPLDPAAAFAFELVWRSGASSAALSAFVEIGVRARPLRAVYRNAA